MLEPFMIDLEFMQIMFQMIVDNQPAQAFEQLVRKSGCDDLETLYIVAKYQVHKRFYDAMCAKIQKEFDHGEAKVMEQVNHLLGNSQNKNDRKDPSQ
jgi:hypothetical protein